MTISQIKVLLIEDNPGDARLIQEMLKEKSYVSFDLICVDKLKAGMEQLAQGNIDLILLDLGLPDSSGLDTFAKLYAEEPNLPIIVLTGLDDENLGLEAVIMGAQDYLVKNQVSGNLLIPAVRYAIERKKMIAKIEQLNASLEAISSINHLIIREKDAEHLIHGACHNFTKSGGYHAAWIMLFDQAKMPLLAAEAGIGKAFSGLISRLKQGESIECMKQALAKPGISIIEDIDSSCGDCSLKNVYKKYKSMCSRLEYDGKIYGIVNVHKPINYALDKKEQELLAEASNDIAYALNKIELEKERRQAGIALKESEERYRDLVEKAAIGILIDDKEGNFRYVNKTYARLFGYSEEELKKLSIRSIVHPDDVGRVMEFHRKRIQGEEVPSRYEFKGIRKDGSIIHLEVDAVELKGEEKIVGSRSYVWDITERKQAREKIEASLREKETLLREVHHRVKNNMQVISSLFNLQSQYIKDKKSSEIFRNCQNRVRSMALIHERLYQAEDLARVDIEEYVQSLISHLFSSYGINPEAMSLSTDIKNVFLDISTAIPCGLIINELVSNSLIHAFPDKRKGEIRIFLKPIDEKEVELTVSDNGIGLPEEEDPKKTDSLGLHLVTILAEDQLHGTVELDRSSGTKFVIRFRRKKL
jgi:PAS domain S-box-containing protein